MCWLSCRNSPEPIFLLTCCYFVTSSQIPRPCFFLLFFAFFACLYFVHYSPNIISLCATWRMAKHFSDSLYFFIQLFLFYFFIWVNNNSLRFRVCCWLKFVGLCSSPAPTMHTHSHRFALHSSSIQWRLSCACYMNGQQWSECDGGGCVGERHVEHRAA